jgi:DNA-binding MarR family transcriptional regulator
MTYENFRADMGERPPGTSIDRIDNARGYEPSNCRWATHAEQQRNRSISKLKPEQVAEIKARYAAGGITQTALAREFGITSAMVSSVVNGQWWQGVGDVALNRQTVRLGAAKLTGEDVQKLRSRHAAGGISLSELAKQYGLSKSGVYGIVTRQRWSAANG